MKCNQKEVIDLQAKWDPLRRHGTQGKRAGTGAIAWARLLGVSLVALWNHQKFASSFSKSRKLSYFFETQVSSSAFIWLSCLVKLVATHCREKAFWKGLSLKQFEVVSSSKLFFNNLRTNMSRFYSSALIKTTFHLCSDWASCQTFE